MGRQRNQRGVAALTLTVLLLFAMLLTVAATHRNAAVETQSASAQLRSSQAFEAAEAGLEWATARLNDDTRLAEDCRPSPATDARSFRERVLSYDSSLPGFRAATWNDAGTARPQQTACRRGDDGWVCSCPNGGVPSLPPAATTASLPGFAVAFSTGSRPGVVVAVATGCTSAITGCADPAIAAHEATARIEVALGLVPGLRSAPVATLTVRGNVDIGAAALAVRNPDPATGGTAIDAGGHIGASALRVAAAPGSPLGASLVSSDRPLAALSTDRVFSRWFGMSQRAWAAQPAVRRLSCTGACSAELGAALASGDRLVWLPGDAIIDGDLDLGDATRPVVIVVGGGIRLRGSVRISGLLYASAVDWQAAPSGASVRGAVLTDGDYTGDAPADLVHDADILARLRSGTGSFVRVNGSWKDF